MAVVHPDNAKPTLKFRIAPVPCAPWAGRLNPEEILRDPLVIAGHGKLSAVVCRNVASHGTLVKDGDASLRRGQVCPGEMPDYRLWF